MDQPVEAVGTGGLMMEEENANVRFEKIDNGFVVHRSWHEGKGNKMKYHNQDVFLDSLPGSLEKLFKKGYVSLEEGNFFAQLKKEKLTPEEDEE